MSLPQGRPAGPISPPRLSQCDLLLAGVPTWRYLSYVSGVNHVRRVITRGRSVWER